MGREDLATRAPELGRRKTVRSLFHRRSSLYIVAADIAALSTAFALMGTWSLRGLTAIILTILFFVSAGLHRSRLSLSALDDSPILAGSTLSAFFLASLVGGGALDSNDVRTALVAVAAVIGGRVLGYWFVRFCRRRRFVEHRTLVIGAGFSGLELTELLLEHPEYGLKPVGYFDPSPVPGIERPLPVLHETTSIANAIREADADVVIVAFASIPESDLVGILRACDRLRTEIFVIPRLYELLHHNSGRDIDNIWGVPVVRLRRASHRSPSWPLKRAFDIVVATLLGFVLLPVVVAVALAVRIAHGPGVFFRQERIGLDGRAFEIVKFRTLIPTDEHDPATNWSAAESQLSTRTGRLLRRFSLDEIPQLWNVLCGDMSLVGPRPERPHFVGAFADQYPSYGARHRVPSGMTGLAQIKGLRGDTSIESRARFDNAYIDGWSVWGDLKVLVLTAVAVVRGGGHR